MGIQGSRKYSTVLIVLTKAFDPNAGGVQRTTFKMGKYFTEQGLDVIYYSFANHGHLPVAHGRLVHALHDRGSKNRANIVHFQEQLAQLRPEIVVNQMPYELEIREALFKSKQNRNFVLLACLRNSLFSVVRNVRDTVWKTLPSAIAWLFDNSLGLHLLLLWHKSRHAKELRQILDKHDRFILLAPPNRDELEYFVGGYGKAKVEFVPNSIPAVNRTKVGKEKLIVHVGRLNDTQKRSDLLIPFWERCVDRLPDWEFIIVGDGPYREKMQRQIDNKKLRGVTMVGYQKPEPYLERAAVFMMPSAYEGFPNTILEAQSHGCVCIAFDSYAALSWIVNGPQTALLCEPFDIGQMAEMMVGLAQNPELLERMRAASYENADRFTIDVVGEQWLNLFDRLCQ